MSLIDKQTLRDLGIKLNNSQYDAMSEQFDTTIHKRVIDQLASLLTDKQIEQLADIDTTSFEDWLDVNVPEFPEIVSDEVDILLGEIAENAEMLSSRLQTKPA